MKETTELYKALDIFNGPGPSIYSLSKDLEYIYFNSKHAQDVSRTIGEKPMISKTCSYFYHLRTMEQSTEIIDKVMQGETLSKKIKIIEFETQNKVLEQEFMPFYDSNGQVEGVTIFERRTPQMNNKKESISSTPLSDIITLLSKAQVGVFILDFSKDQVSVNEPIIDMLGSDKIQDLSDINSVLKKVLRIQDYKSILKLATRKNISQFHFKNLEIKKPEEKSIFLNLAIEIKQRDKNGRPKIVQGTIFEVVKNDSNSELAIEIMDKKLRGFMDSSKYFGFWEWDAIKKVSTLSNNWLDLFGYTREDIGELGEDAFLNRIVHPEDKGLWLRKIKENIRLNLDRFSLQLRYKDKKGNWRWLLSNASLIRNNKSGKPEYYMGSDLDITILKKKEAELEAWRKKFSKIIDATHTGVWSWNLKKDHLEINSQFAEMLGYTKREIENAGISFLMNKTHPEDGDLLEFASLPIEGYKEKEIRVKDSNNNYIWLKLRLSVESRFEDGSLEVISGICMNINEKKQDQLKIEESEKRLITLLAGTKAATWHYNDETQEFIYDDRMVSLIGFTRKEISTNEKFFHYSRIHPSDRVKLEKQYRNKDSNYYELEIRKKHKNGDWVWILERGFIEKRYPNGYPMNIYGIQLDINERKTAVEKLSHSLSHLKLAVDTGKIGVISVDVFNNTVRSNQEYLDIYEIEENDDMVKPFLWKERVLPEDLHIAQEGFDNLQKGISVSNVSFRIYTKSGVKKVITSATPKRNDSGEVEKIVAVIIDVSDAFNKEIQLEKLVNQQAQMLKEMHHRIKNNLATISSIISLKSRNLAEIPDVKEVMSEVNKKIVSMSVIHDRLLKEKEIEKHNLSCYLKDITNRLLELVNFENKKITLQFDVDDYPFKEIVLLNLGMALQEIISNKIKHAFTNSTEGTLIIKGSKLNEDYILKVGDNGVKFTENKAKNPNSIGMLIIGSFISDLKGSFEFGPDKQGSTYAIKIPIKNSMALTEDDIIRNHMSISA